jgi:hypothetical protein
MYGREWLLAVALLFHRVVQLRCRHSEWQDRRSRRIGLIRYSIGVRGYLIRVKFKLTKVISPTVSPSNPPGRSNFDDMRIRLGLCSVLSDKFLRIFLTANLCEASQIAKGGLSAGLARRIVFRRKITNGAKSWRVAMLWRIGLVPVGSGVNFQVQRKLRSLPARRSGFAI